MHKDDEMTPIERMEGFLTGKSIDRSLAMPFTVSMAGKAAGMTHREKRSSAKNQAMAQVACYERFGHDLMIMEYAYTVLELHLVAKQIILKMQYPH